MKYFSIISFVLFSILIVQSCKGGAEVANETQDTVEILDTIFISPTDTITVAENIYNPYAVFYLVRHANTSNNNLTTLGLERAEELGSLFSNIELDEVFSSNTNRTIGTATPVAEDQNLTLQLYNPSQLETFSDTLINNYENKKVLIVGHSNTTPYLLDILAGTDGASDIPFSQFDNLYILIKYKRTSPEVFRLKYGAETP